MIVDDTVFNVYLLRHWSDLRDDMEKKFVSVKVISYGVSWKNLCFSNTLTCAISRLCFGT